jgi:16S rRNA (guanine966-N2)-methyltransferase
MGVGEQRMRVVAGIYRGRTLAAPKGDSTRPTTDRVRESLFSSLTSLIGAELGGGRVLDAFAGSGALGIEALSRGCSAATFVESDREALAALRTNIDSLGAQNRARVIDGDMLALASRGTLVGAPFSLLLLDPPYRLAWCDIERLTSALAHGGMLEDGGVIVYEHAADRLAEWPAEFDLTARKKYGSTGIDIVVYQRGARAL